MALFNSVEDRALPILTQVYQLKVSSLPWGLRPETPDEIEAEEEQREFYIRQLGPGKFERDSPYYYGLLSEQQDFALLTKATHDILDNLADGNKVRHVSVELYLEFLGKIRAPHISGDSDKRGMIDLSQIHFVDDGTHGAKSSLFAQVINDLTEVIQAHREGKRVLDRCEACRSVFVVNRTGQQYCSRRCLQRIGKRRRRAAARDKQPLKLQLRGRVNNMYSDYISIFGGHGV